MIKKRFLKVNILFLIMCLVFATLPFNSFAESRNQQSLSENFFVHENINGEKVYTSVIQNNETDEETKIVMTEKGQLYEVEVYVNGVFDHRVIRDTSSDKLYLLTNEGSTKTIDVKNFITVPSRILCKS